MLTVQHRPSGLVASQTQHPLQAQGADALLLIDWSDTTRRPATHGASCDKMRYRNSSGFLQHLGLGASSLQRARATDDCSRATLQARVALKPTQCALRSGHRNLRKQTRITRKATPSGFRRVWRSITYAVHRRRLPAQAYPQTSWPLWRQAMRHRSRRHPRVALLSRRHGCR